MISGYVDLENNAEWAHRLAKIKVVDLFIPPYIQCPWGLNANSAILKLHIHFQLGFIAS